MKKSPQMKRVAASTLMPTLLATVLTGCASLPSMQTARPTAPEPLPAFAPKAWQAPLPIGFQTPMPHGGKPIALGQWWARFNDPTLVELIDKAQALSPSVAAAKSRIAGADAARVAASSKLSPSAAVQASGQRSNASGPASTVLQVGAQASWEIDVFGKNQAALDAELAGLQGAQAAWHEARVSVAAEVARAYLGLRLCEQQTKLLALDIASRVETQRLIVLTTSAGLVAPANLGLGEASVAEGQSRLNSQTLMCNGLATALGGLTGVQASDLRTKPHLVTGSIGSSDIKNEVLSLTVPGIDVPQLPADLLRQRPDVYRAERELLSSAAQISQADAAQKPTVSIGGILGSSRISGGGFTQSGPSWTLGPVSITMPLLASKSLAAAASAARAAHEANEVNYKSVVRQAVREVDDSLATLASTAERTRLNATAAQGYRAYFTATKARHKAGLASLVELEDARRILLSADTSVLAVEQERVGAWINLYRAAGGGWSVDAPVPAPTASK